jgi:hypothetical protein
MCYPLFLFPIRAIIEFGLVFFQGEGKPGPFPIYTALAAYLLI